MNTRGSGFGGRGSDRSPLRVPSPEPRTPNRLPRQVKLFGWVSLLNDFASEMIYPLLPAFVTGVLGGGPQALGALDGAAEFAAAVVKLGAGRLGKGLRTPPRDALIADATPAGLVGRAFGLQRGMDHAGAVLGPILAWWLLASGSAGLRTVIGASAVPGVVVLVLAMWAVKGAAGRGKAREGGDDSPAPPAPFRGLSRPSAPALLAISAFYLLRMPDTLIILRSQQLGVPVAVVPLLWAAVHVVRSASSFAGGAASDRLGPGQTMWLGWLAYTILAVGMARAGTAAAAWGWFLGLGLVAGLTESPERSLVARLAGAHRGSGFGVYHGVTGFAALVGGVALGAVFQRYGAGPAFLASAAGGLGLVLGWPVLARAGVWRWRGVR